MTNTSEEITEELNFEIRKIWDNKELGIVESNRLEEKLKQKKWFSEGDVRKILAPIYEACNDQRPFEIQRLISDKVKELKL